MTRLSDLLGLLLVDQNSHSLGRLADVVVWIIDHDPPVATGFLVRQEGEEVFAPLAAVTELRIGPSRLILRPLPRLDAFVRRSQEVLLERDLLDGTVIDLREPRLVRVNDLMLEIAGTRLTVVGVDVGPRALLYRLLPRAFRREAEPRLVTWPDLELLSSELPEGILVPDHARLARLHPTDIARLAEAAPVRQATEILAALTDDLAADTMEEMADEKQAEVVEQLDPERAADILEHMAPDAAADVLAELEPDAVNAVLRLMNAAEAAEVHALLTYPKHTAGGLMTTDFVTAPPDLTVRDATTYLRPQLSKPDWVYYIYVVDDKAGQKLLGVFSLRDLLLAPPDASVAAIMETQPRCVGPDTPAATVAQIMSDYNLLALPVTDEEERLLGIVSVDDALEIVLPPDLRRRLPRIFS
jgi:CBS domain-containing protein